MDNNTGKRGGGIWVGLLIILVGCGMLCDRLLNQIGLSMPTWIISWPTLLIAFGLISGIRHRFRNLTWAFLIMIGAVYLTNEIIPQMHTEYYALPLCIMGMGLILVLGRHHSKEENQKLWQTDRAGETAPPFSSQNTADQNEILDSFSFIGGVHKKIFSKNFQGGQITNFVGGTEIDLSQTDIKGIVRLSVTQVCGGTKLIVPPHWVVKSEIVIAFGSIDDKRSNSGMGQDPGKVLILSGTTIFGGIELKSF